MPPIGWVALLGAVGSSLRFLAQSGIERVFGPPNPWGTLAVNLLGSAAMGALAAALEAGRLPPEAKPALAAGLLGGFTTYSAFNQHLLDELAAGRPGRAGLVAAATLVGCVACGLGGQLVVRGLLR